MSSYHSLSKEERDEFWRQFNLKRKETKKKREEDEKHRVRREYEEECRKLGIEP